jgi:tRNA 5-methylaminomethyl-2-thiouridine biosynthesis bifunctional protein
VIGAGLAGAAAAAALAEQGLAVTVVEAAAAPARGASGNAAGLFRSTLQGDDGVHARWYRAAALETERVARPLVGAGTVAGAIGGVLQPAVDGAATAALLQRLGWPAGFVEVVDPARASSLAGLATEAPACLFAAGGWLAPGALVEHWLRASGAQLLTGARVQRLQHRDAACGAGALPTWQALDDTGRVIAAAPVVVLANAGAAADLAPWAGWPLARTRGQVTQVPAGTPGLRSPRRPLARRGYALTLPGGDLLCGATSAADDGDDPALRAADHRHNLDVLERLTGGRVDPAAPGLGGRVGWRCGTPDRLPLVGAVPSDAAACRDARRLDQPRLVPRTPGLFVLCALGSRGITSAALGGRLVAGAATGAPMALEAGLLDALDPARFVARAARRR